MLIYEKVVDGERHLYGTQGNVPAESDEQCTYKDAQDKAVAVDFNTPLFDNGAGGMKKADGTTVNMWLGNDNIIPGNLEGGDPKTECLIHSFNVGTAKNPVMANINDTAITYQFTDASVDLTKLKPIADVSSEATIKISGHTEIIKLNGKNILDCSSPVSLIVTAEDGTHTKTYTVTITKVASE